MFSDFSSGCVVLEVLAGQDGPGRCCFLDVHGTIVLATLFIHLT